VLGLLLLISVVGLLTPLLMLIALSNAPDISTPRPCSRSLVFGMTTSEEVGEGERARRFFRALRLRMNEIMRNIIRRRMKMNKAPTPIFTATFIRGPDGALLCAWLLVVVLRLHSLLLRCLRSPSLPEWHLQDRSLQIARAGSIKERRRRAPAQSCSGLRSTPSHGRTNTRTRRSTNAHVCHSYPAGLHGRTCQHDASHGRHAPRTRRESSVSVRNMQKFSAVHASTPLFGVVFELNPL